MTVETTETSEPEKELKPVQHVDPAPIESSPVTPEPVTSISPVGAQAKIAAEADDKFQHLDPRYIVVERIAGAVFGLCVAAAAVIGFGIWLAASWPPGFVFWLSLAGLVLALGILAWTIYALPALDHRRASWRLSASGLEIRRGIFWRREITVPRARVQHTDVQQGPLQRQYGVAKLVVHTAGTVAASVELSGLSLPIAKWLRDALIDDLRGTSDAV